MLRCIPVTRPAMILGRRMSAQASPSVDPVDLAARLLRLGLLEPPGREQECIRLIADVLSRSGVESRVLARPIRRGRT